MQLHAQYYYQQLPPQERAAYHGMLSCLRELTPSARIPRLPMETLSTLFFQLRLDHPEIFYAVGFSCRAVPEAAFVEFWPEYRFEKKRIREHRQAIEARVTRLLRPLRSLPPAEQERAIHDFVVENVRYDKLEKPYSHEVIGPLTNGVGVCEGMAKTVKLLCDGLGLPCMIAVSDRDRANGERYLHAWNIVQLGGQCYHLDATFDNSLSKYGTRYDYFNLDDTKIFRDHRPLLYPAPPCTDGGQFYYKLQHLSWTKPEEAARRVDQALRKKQPGLVFHWRGGYLTREVLAELCLQIGILRGEQLPQTFVHFPVDLKERLGHFVGRNGLEQIADDVVIDRGARVFEAVVAAENDDLRCRTHFAHAPGKLKSGDHRHPDVGQNQVWLQLVNQIQRFHTVFRFPHNLKACLAPAHPFDDRLPQFLFIIHNQNGIFQAATPPFDGLLLLLYHLFWEKSTVKF